jgi:hypothetical protein
MPEASVHKYRDSLRPEHKIRPAFDVFGIDSPSADTRAHKMRS